MQTQDLSYKLNNVSFPLSDEFEGTNISFEVFSLENVYTLDKSDTTFAKNKISCNSLLWGNEEKVEASLNGEIDGNRIKVTADAPFSIRSIKVRFDDLPLGKLVSMMDFDREITEQGHVFNYPEGWRSLSHPLIIIELENGKYFYLRCLDKSVVRKTFFLKRQNGKLRIDVVQEQQGCDLSDHFECPIIEFGFSNTKKEIISKQSEYMRNTFSLKKFEDSEIVPNWLKKISLVATVHMEAFTGYVFHTYKKAYEDIEKLTHYISGEKILVYLAGWEGRYYFKYGNYCPDERLGGSEDLKLYVDKIQKLGCKVIAMYGINVANRNLPNIAKIYKDAEFESISGSRFHNGSVDWEGAHHYDFGDFSNLNIGNPLWADELFRQIKENTEKYNFDGAFLDIAAVYVNDRKHPITEGIKKFSDRLRTIKPEFLVAGEGYYDGLTNAIALFQSGHTDGELHYHDRLDEDLFADYTREFAHLCLGDPSRGSSGVHELGTNDIYNVPLRKGVIPTISLVEDSIDSNNPRFMEIIERAKEYDRKYIK